MVFIVRLNFVSRFPNFKQTDSRMKPIEYSQWHGNVRDDSPCPVSEKFQMCRSKLCPIFFQGINGPHGHISHNEKRYQFPSRFIFCLFDGSTPSEPTIQDEHGLKTGLDEGKYLRSETNRTLGFHGEVVAYEGEHAIYEHAGLCYYEESIVQTDSSVPFFIYNSFPIY